MTHTEESLAHLINDALNTAEKAEADHCSPMGSPQFRQSNADAREAETALRLAIREVLAELDEWKRIADDRFSMLAENKGALHWKERAEKAEAECERLRNALDRASRVMHGEGVEDQGEAWDKCLRILDAAMKEQP